MLRIHSLGLALAALLLAQSPAFAGNFAVSVVSYEPGAGYAAGFTNLDAALGEPSKVNPFTEETDPFNPPYGKTQILSIGEGGSVVLKFNRPVHNFRRPRQNGADFIVFGNSGFIITNGFNPDFTWIGEPATDGSLFGANVGQTRVSVSRDGEHFYALDSERAPVVDMLFPTDGSGDPCIAVDSALTAADFAGATVDGIRDLYDGSAGGASFDIAWAKRENGKPARLSFIRYVKIEVISGVSEIDAVSAVTKGKR